jgi:hypothetical protein
MTEEKHTATGGKDATKGGRLSSLSPRLIGSWEEHLWVFRVVAGVGPNPSVTGTRRLASLKQGFHVGTELCKVCRANDASAGTERPVLAAGELRSKALDGDDLAQVLCYIERL